MLSPTQLKAVDKIGSAAVIVERLWGIPAELTSAQCCIESGYLAHAPKNNCFGIKEYEGCLGRQLLFTVEYFTDAELARFLARGDGRTAVLAMPPVTLPSGRKKYKVQDWFAVFATLADCFAKRGKMFLAGRYAPFAEAYRVDSDLEKLVKGIAPIYATDAGYADAVLKMARRPEIMAAISKARLAS